MRAKTLGPGGRGVNLGRPARESGGVDVPGHLRHPVGRSILRGPRDRPAGSSLWASVGFGVMSWLYLVVAILFEVVGTSAMKMSEGMTRLGPAAVVVVCYGIAFLLLAKALRTMEVGIAYAIWSATGTAAIAAIGVFVFGESLTVMKVVGILLIVAGVISLHMASGPA